MQSSNYIVDFRNVCRAQDEKLKQSSSLQQYAGFLAKALYNTFMHEKYVWNYLTPDGKAKFVNDVANYYHSLPFASAIDNEALCQAFSLELWGMFLQRILTTLHSKLINTQLLNQATLNSKEEFMDGVWLYLQRQPIAIRQHVAELLWDHHESNAKLEVAPTSRTPY